MLWEKESNDPDALYYDIFAYTGEKPPDLLEIKPMPAKDDAISLEKRKAGNELYVQREWWTAMEKYNESLCYAPRGSENISLAYANRSTCFYYLEMFTECLADIELAKAAGYPDHLMFKLDKRRDECLKRIAEGAKPDEFGLKLSFDPDETFPCMANVVKFKRDADKSYSLFAKEDIAVGQTIVVEKAFSTFLNQRFGWRCSVCLKTNCNLMPCEDCTGAMFCSQECRERLHRKYECNSRVVRKDNHIDEVALHDVRLIMQITDMFSSADELMEFIEEANKDDPKKNELPDLSNEKSKLRAYLKLPLSPKMTKLESIQINAHETHILLQKTAKIKSMFTSEQHDRFLKHLVMQMAVISNEHSVRYTTKVNQGEQELVSSHTSLIKRYFKHSCAPNVHWADRDGRTVFVTILPVKKGQQLFVNSIGIHSYPKEKRDERLGDTCKCERCEGIGATPVERLQVVSDPNYEQLSFLLTVRINDNETLSHLSGFCVEFLQKHGHIKWCDEIAKIMWPYTKLISFRLAGFKLSPDWGIDMSNQFY